MKNLVAVAIALGLLGSISYAKSGSSSCEEREYVLQHYVTLKDTMIVETYHGQDAASRCDKKAAQYTNQAHQQGDNWSYFCKRTY